MTFKHNNKTNKMYLYWFIRHVNLQEHVVKPLNLLTKNSSMLLCLKGMYFTLVFNTVYFKLYWRTRAEFSVWVWFWTWD